MGIPVSPFLDIPSVVVKDKVMASPPRQSISSYIETTAVSYT